MDSVFSSAFLLVQPPVCLGRRLLPFSLGHSLVLESIGSPVLLGADVTPGDLAVAVYVCSRLATDLNQALDFAQEAAQFRAWGEKTTLADAEADLVLFRAYLGEFLKAPERWEGETRGSAPKAPWQYTIATALRKHLAMRYDEVWNCPVNRALADYAALGEALGDESLISEDERREIAGSAAEGSREEAYQPEAQPGQVGKANQSGQQPQHNQQRSHGPTLSQEHHDRK